MLESYKGYRDVNPDGGINGEVEVPEMWVLEYDPLKYFYMSSLMVHFKIFFI